ncbi:hypothetical protein ACWGQ5_21415 [Streptomyces sp. NPDC055722]
MRVLGATQFALTYGLHPMPGSHLMENIRLFGAEAAPRVREALASGPQHVQGALASADS